MKIIIDTLIGGKTVTYEDCPKKDKRPYVFLDSESEELRMLAEIADVFGYKVPITRK